MQFCFVQWIDRFIRFDGSYLSGKVVRDGCFLVNRLRLAFRGMGAIDSDDGRDRIANGGGKNGTGQFGHVPRRTVGRLPGAFW